MDLNERNRLFERALQAYRGGRLKDSVRDLHSLLSDGSRDPRHVSYCGLLLAKTEGNIREGLVLCERAAKQGFYDPQMYLNLAELELHNGNRRRAIEVLRRGVRIDPEDRRFHRELGRINPRNQPVLPFLRRNHRVNRYLGLTRARLCGFGGQRRSGRAGRRLSKGRRASR